MKKFFLEKLEGYVGNSLLIPELNVGVVDIIVKELKNGKAAGRDDLTCEHLKNSHPVLICILTKLFSNMLKSGYVPNSFSEGILIPIPKNDKRNLNLIADYRGITICNIISKIFEKCILFLIKQFLVTSERQFGFKKETGCQQAIFAVRKVVDYYTANGSNVNLCTIDLASAFDRINYCLLFTKLMEIKLSKNVITVLVNWYSKLFSVVKWGTTYSNIFQIIQGVRQGGVISPLFFAIFVNNVLHKLMKSKLGCYINYVCMNSFMYADYLLLLSISLHDLQKLVDLCVIEFNNIGMTININKSACVRIGSRHNKVMRIIIKETELEWKNEIRYLGEGS